MTAAGRRRRFVLVDPCLTGPGSHPYHYAAVVLAAAARAGCDCRLVAHRTCTAPVDGWPTLAAFTHTAYSKHTLAGGLDRLDVRGRPGLLPAAPWTIRHARRRREERIAAFARELLPALDGLAAGDVVFVATASELEAAGLARAIAAARPPRGVGWHVQFHLPILRGFAADYARQEAGFDEARRAVREAAAAAARPVRYHATTEELAGHYARLLDDAVDSLPYPVQAPAPRPRRAEFPLRAACLGDARPEKHSECLPAVVAAVVADPEMAGRLRFAVQSNPGYPPASRRREHLAVTRALAALGRAGAAAPLELLAGPLDAESYARELAAADILLLPYDQGRYRCRCSGVVLEALAAGAVPIVTGGGWMGRQLAEPLAAHAAAITARGRTLATRRIDRPRIGRRPLSIPLSPAESRDGPRRTAVTVEVAWEGTGRERLDLPPVRVAVTGGPRPPTVLAAGAEGDATTAVFPLDARAGDGLRIDVTAACDAAVAAVDSITIRELAVPGPVPAAAVGLVIDAAADLPAALREVVRHADHYLATAAAHADRVRRAVDPDEVVRRLLS